MREELTLVGTEVKGIREGLNSLESEVKGICEEATLVGTEVKGISEGLNSLESEVKGIREERPLISGNITKVQEDLLEDIGLSRVISKIHLYIF